MKDLLIIIFTIASVASFWLFLRQYKLSPVWLMLSVGSIAIANSELHLSTLELLWPGKFWSLLIISLVSFIFGVWVFGAVWERWPWWQKLKIFTKPNISVMALRSIIYVLFVGSLGALYLFHKKVGAFPLLASDPDQFRFTADVQAGGVISYSAQLARVFIPLSFCLMFW